MPLTDAPFRSLQLTEAQARFDLLDVTSYDVRLAFVSRAAVVRPSSTSSRPG